MPIVVSYADEVASFSIPANILQDGHLNICKPQIGQVDVADIIHDRSRPAVLATLIDLLQGGANCHTTPAIDAVFKSGEPLLVVLPEYALGSADWGAIDACVSQVNRPIVLIVGFGATVGAWIKAWAAANQPGGGTQRCVSWTCTLLDSRPVNGGWCWIHGFRNEPTTCITFVKNWFDQREEIHYIEGIQGGDHIVSLDFIDLQILPFLCSDLIQDPLSSGKTGRQRLKAHLRRMGRLSKPVLVTASTYQNKTANINWHNAISDVVTADEGNRHIVLALANQASDRPVAAEADDRWRALTGVYGSFSSLARGQPPLTWCRPLLNGNTSGAVARVSAPHLIVGEIHWPNYGPTTSGYIWRTITTAPIGYNGLGQVTVHPVPIEQIELHRFTRRHPADQEWSSQVRDGLEALRSHLDSGSAPIAPRLVDSMLGGLTREATVKPDEWEKVTEALKAAVYALACLQRATSATWQDNDAQHGQLRLDDRQLHVLVWRDPKKTAGAMEREIGVWSSNTTVPHPPLLVIGAGVQGNPLSDNSFVGDRRDNFVSDPPANAAIDAGGVLAPEPDSILEPKALRQQVAILGLNRISGWYMDGCPEDAAAKQAKLAQLLAILQCPGVAA